ncbi:MAG: eukaryotic-like serine/threonine-protein kinase, partial [Frankiaceae bacterium]|nr:eukaryotic-like serine/threonine-protein kinase [Frankiaceae bacterium]
THAPNVLNFSKSAAIKALDDEGLHAHWLPGIHTDTVDSGLVARQNPGSGARVHKGATIDLRLSLGPEIVTVPDVTGLTVKAARTAIEQAHLSVGEQTEAYSTDVKTGRIISTDPKPDARVHASRSVNLVVSQGPQPVDVPDVSGKTYDEAASILTSLDLQPGRRDVYSDTVPEGTVIATRPPPGATAHAGDTITVNVSRGPHLYRVPDVTGENVDDAVQQLQDAGFKTNVHAFPGGPGDVLRQSPSGGSMERRGTTITLFVF